MGKETGAMREIIVDNFAGGGGAIKTAPGTTLIIGIFITDIIV